MSGTWDKVWLVLCGDTKTARPEVASCPAGGGGEQQVQLLGAWTRFCFTTSCSATSPWHACTQVGCDTAQPRGLVCFKCSTVTKTPHEQQGASKGFFSPHPTGSHRAGARVFSNDLSCCDSLQPEETLSSIFWGQIFMTET